MADNILIKRGRPERSKQSYQVQVQQLKQEIKQKDNELLFLNLYLESTADKLHKYQNASLTNRLKYLFKGE